MSIKLNLSFETDGKTVAMNLLDMGCYQSKAEAWKSSGDFPTFKSCATLGVETHIQIDNVKVAGGKLTVSFFLFGV